MPQNLEKTVMPRDIDRDSGFVLIVAEKPSVARDIAKVVRASRRADGYLEGNGYRITWALGHLVGLAEPQAYQEAWGKRWSFSQLPMVPDQWQLVALKSTAKQFGIVKRLMNDTRTKSLVCATDAGREGENIFRLIYRHARCKKPFQRLWVSSLTDEAIRNGMANLQAGADFDALGHAAFARTQADWLVGLNLTRAYTVHHGQLLTIGRVQTPTLAMIVKRDKEISSFVKHSFYELVATFREGFWAKYTIEKSTKIESKPQAERLLRELQGVTEGKVLAVEDKLKRHRPPPLYDLITLQREANQKYGYTAAKVLEFAQQLYERHKLISYPRTESKHIAEDMVPQLPGILSKLDHPQAAEALARLKGGFKLGKAYVDSTKLSDHHGILPTGDQPNKPLHQPLKHIYDLVVARFVGMFLPEHLVDETTVRLDLAGHPFVAKGSEVRQVGWKVVQGPEKSSKQKEKRQKLPPLKKGQMVTVSSCEMLEKETAPPKPYTDATLLSAMKNAGKEIEDDHLALAMKESGLGTPATRAEMIEKLIRTKLVERRKKQMFPTDKGRALIEVVAEPLRNPEMTARWEQRLKDIEEGRERPDHFHSSIVEFVSELIPRVRQGRRLPPERNTTASRKRRAADHHGSKRAKTPSSPKTQPAGIGLGDCPHCTQGRVVAGKQNYGCLRFREGCQFRLPMMVAGKKITEKQVSSLLDKGKTRKIKGFTGKSGEPFEAVLTLDKQGKLGFEKARKSTPKAEIKAVGRTCPVCKQGNVIEGKRGFGCNRYREGCRFVVWRSYAGKELTQHQLVRLIEKGESPLIKGFKSHDGQKFKGRLKLESSGEIQMVVDPD